MGLAQIKQKNQNFQIPKDAHFPLTLIFLESRKTLIYVVFRDFQKNPEKRTFTPHHLDLYPPGGLTPHITLVEISLVLAINMVKELFEF